MSSTVYSSFSYVWLNGIEDNRD